MTQNGVKTLTRIPQFPVRRSNGTRKAGGHALQPFVDVRLAFCIKRALRETGYLPLRAVEVRVSEGAVVLSGRVPSYYLKQLAQSITMSFDEVCDIRNDLDVVCPK